MIQPELPRGPSPRSSRRRWWAATVVLLIGAAVLLTAGVRGHDGALNAQATTRLVPPPDAFLPARVAGPVAESGVVAAPPVAVAPPVARSVPVELRIPSIGVSVPVSELGLNPDDTVEVPTDFQKPGWFNLGPSPGQPGSAVILGHVDSYKGPAVFFRLRALQAGDDIEVGLADGAVAHFVVTSVAMYPKDQFPAQQVYGAHDGSALQLVTCGGEFDSKARSYLSNVVVYTSLAAMTPTAAPPGAAVGPVPSD